MNFRENHSFIIYQELQKKPIHTFKCFSSVSKMRLLQICNDPFKVIGQMWVKHPMGGNNAEFD